MTPFKMSKNYNMLFIISKIELLILYVIFRLWYFSPFVQFMLVLVSDCYDTAMYIYKYLCFLVTFC